MTKIINIKSGEKYDVYCGRGSIFGNPFEIGRDGDRNEVIKKYNKWFNFLLKDKIFLIEIIKLKDKTLGCYCIPESCHCQIIKEFLDSGDRE